MWYFILIVVLVVVLGILGANYEHRKEEERGDDIKDKMNSFPDFCANVTISGVNKMYLFSVDNVNKKIMFVNEFTNMIVPFDKIISVELIEDNTILSSKSLLRTVGGTVIGGALAGGAGAIVGGLSGNQKQEKTVSKVQVKLRLRDISKSSLTISCFDSKTMTIEGKSAIKTTSMEGYKYKQGLEDAKKICDIVSVIIDEVDHKTQDIKTNKENVDQPFTIEQIEKLVALKEKGALTDDEFNKMKASIISNNATSRSSGKEESIIEIDDIPQDIKDAIDSGQVILAVKLYKDYNNCSLKEAKDFVDNYRR